MVAKRKPCLSLASILGTISFSLNLQVIGLLPEKIGELAGACKLLLKGSYRSQFNKEWDYIYIMGIFSWSRVKHNISKYKTVQIFSPSRPLDQINGKKRTASWELFFQLHQNKQSPAPEQSRLTEGRKHCLFPVWKTMQLGFIGMEVKSFEVMSVMWVLMLKKYILWKSSLAMQME